MYSEDRWGVVSSIGMIKRFMKSEITSPLMELLPNSYFSDTGLHSTPNFYFPLHTRFRSNRSSCGTILYGITKSANGPIRTNWRYAIYSNSMHRKYPYKESTLCFCIPIIWIILLSTNSPLYRIRFFLPKYAVARTRRDRTLLLPVMHIIRKPFPDVSQMASVAAP